MTTVNRLLATLSVLALCAVGACGGDDSNPPPDAAPDTPDAAGTPDGGTPDGGAPLTFEAWVVDLVDNRTAGNTDPAAGSEFLTLPESGDPAAFDSLFP